MRNLISFLLVLWPLTMSAYEDPRIRCVMNLRQIAGAKQMLQIDKSLASGTPCEPAALAQYLQGRLMPHCPANGVYTVGPIGVEPSCSIAGHSDAALEEDIKRQQARDHFLPWGLSAGGALVLGGICWRILASRTRGTANKHLQPTPR